MRRRMLVEHLPHSHDLFGYILVILSLLARVFT